VHRLRTPLGNSIGILWTGLLQGRHRRELIPDSHTYRTITLAITRLIGSQGTLPLATHSPVQEGKMGCFPLLMATRWREVRWDLATAIGQPYQPPDSLVGAVDSFAREAIAPAMRDAGMFAAPLEAPAGATPIERLVAFTGRAVATTHR
jgi:hypothetical protein